MPMTKEEKFAKKYIMTELSKQGYPTYANLLSYFDFNFTSDPSVVAFMEPSTGRIVVNRGLDEEQVSVVIRHEILHNYLKHEDRLLKKLSDETGVDYSTLTDTEFKDLNKKLKDELYSNTDFNYAADYEISNLAYTDRDKETIKQINVNGEILRGLVTEDDHPDWVELSVEEMYDELRKERLKKVDSPSRYMGRLINGRTFVDMNGVVYGV